MHFSKIVGIRVSSSKQSWCIWNCQGCDILLQ